MVRALIGAGIFFCLECRSQEAVRTSLGGGGGGGGRERGLADQKANMRLGPVSLRFGSQFSMEANDNVKLEKHNEECDLILRPQLNVVGVWRITERNSLTFSTGVGYQYYVFDTETGSFYLTPGSEISFDLYVKDFIINVHNRFSYTPDVSGDAQVSGVGSRETLDNTTGVTVTWDLNDMVLMLGYDHVIHRVEESDSSNEDRTQDLFSLSGGFRLRPTTMVGVQVSGGFTDNDGEQNPDNSHVAGGVFYSAQLSERFRLRATVGYVTYFFDDPPSGSGIDIDSTVSAVYADLSVQHRVSESYSHALMAGRKLQAGFYNDTTDTIFANYSASWRLFRKTSFRYTLSFEHYEDTQDDSDSGQRYGFGCGFYRPLTEKLSASVDYNFYLKNADDSAEDYTQNRLVLALGYSF